MIRLLPFSLVALAMLVAVACFPPEAQRAHVWALMLVPDPQAACVGQYAMDNYDGVDLDESQDLVDLYRRLTEPELLQVFGLAAGACSFDRTLADQSHWNNWTRGMVKAMDGGMALSRPDWDEEQRWCVGANLIRQYDPVPLNQMSEEAKGDLADSMYPTCVRVGGSDES